MAFSVCMSERTCPSLHEGPSLSTVAVPRGMLSPIRPQLNGEPIRRRNAMKTTRAPTKNKLDTIYSRQKPGRFGSEYEPSIRAERGEAPSISHASKIYFPKLQRDVHCLSLPERHFACFAIYHPKLWDLHEQKMMSPIPTAHPLYGHPRAAGLTLPGLPGTIAALAHVSPSSQHNFISIDSSEKPGERVPIAYPYVGDQLLFLEDKDGPYCVNWNVKSDPEGFISAPNVSIFDKKKKSRKLSPDVRRNLEHFYYAQGLIKTIDATPQALHPRLIGNLMWLVGKIGDGIATKELVAFYSNLPNACSLPPNVIASRASEWSGLSFQQCKSDLWKCIWNRDLKVDLFQTIFDHLPMQPQVIDPIVVYHHLFSRVK